MPKVTYEPAPRLLKAVTAIPFDLQNLSSFSYEL